MSKGQLKIKRTETGFLIYLDDDLRFMFRTAEEVSDFLVFCEKEIGKPLTWGEWTNENAQPASH